METSAPIFLDGFGRRHDDLRVSVTDRCNLRCTYCMPAEPEWFPRADILSFEEIDRLVRLTVSAGVRKVRLTGGEPLVRRDLPRLVAMLADIEDLDDLSLTTNGLLLARHAADLAAAGLRRVNVSLDTLEPELFRKLTRRDGLDSVLAGLDAAVASGLGPVKLNTVLMRGVNDEEAERLVERGREHGWEVRFIEFMPLDNDGRWQPERVVPGHEIRRRIHARWPIDADPQRDPHAPATRYTFRDGRGSLGFIDSVSAPFCSSCSRLRLTSDGGFRVCLYDTEEIDLKRPMRDGASDADLLALMRSGVSGKGRGGALELVDRRRRRPADGRPVPRSMHQIGG